MRADGEVFCELTERLREVAVSVSELTERSYFASLPNFTRSCAERQRTDGEVLLRLSSPKNIAVPLCQLANCSRDGGWTTYIFLVSYIIIRQIIIIYPYKTKLSSPKNIAVPLCQLANCSRDGGWTTYIFLVSYIIIRQIIIIYPYKTKMYITCFRVFS